MRRLILTATIVVSALLSTTVCHGEPPGAAPNHPPMINKAISDSSAYAVYKSHNKVRSGEIKYLIHLIKKSEYKIVREGREYSATQAAQYLNIKYKTHALKISSTEDFIDTYASYTKAGDPIYVVNRSGNTFLARQVLYSELRQLREFESRSLSQAGM